MNKLVGAWLCVVVVACAASPKATMAPARPEASSAGAPAPMPGSDPRAEIAQLSDDIERQRAQLNLPAPAPIPSAPEAMSAHQPGVEAPPVAPPHDQDAACHPAPSQTCTDSCTLGDSICKNAGRICDLADDMTGDAWAAGKCDSAKQTCSDAHKRCCECT